MYFLHPRHLMLDQRIDAVAHDFDQAFLVPALQCSGLSSKLDLANFDRHGPAEQLIQKTFALAKAIGPERQQAAFEVGHQSTEIRLQPAHQLRCGFEVPLCEKDPQLGE